MKELREKYDVKSGITLTKNDKAWLCLIDKHSILKQIENKGYFIIKSKEINRFRESRLMAKFDHSINLPEVFKNNNLSILPISRRSYIIAKMNTYHQLDIDDTHVHHIDVPQNLESLDFENITSESTAINCALAANIFADFLEDDSLVPTIDGRMGSGDFSFNIGKINGNDYTVEVNNSQIEIDAGIEGTNYVSLIEAKRDVSDDFLVRQLYYPFKTWNERINKPVKSIYLVYSNGIFHLHEYKFENPNKYDSIQLVKRKNYSFEQLTITLEQLFNLSKQNYVTEPKVPFPQADNFNRIINLGELLKNNDNEVLTREYITNHYAFDVRQTNYYIDALRYLGLAERKHLSGRIPYYYLTNVGNEIFGMSSKNRNIALIQKILEHEVFNKVFTEWLKNGRPNSDIIVSLMKTSNLYRIESDSTFMRRSSTIAGWINWIFKQVEK